MSVIIKTASKLIGFLSGGLGSKIIEGVKDYFPPSMSDKEKADLKLKILEITHAQENKLLQLANDADTEFNQRIKDMEGTASDLKAIPIFGTIILFARGCQRPVWGFFTLFMDYLVFSGTWDLSDPQLKNAFFAINLLVLGFLFGERAVKNVMPLFDKYIGKK